MLYNKDNPQWFFSEEQFISAEESDRIVNEYDQLCRNMLKTDIRDINRKFYGIKETADPEDREANRKKQLIGAVFGIVIFAGMILSLIFKQLVLFGYIGCSLFLIAGISMMLTGRGEVVESTSKMILNRGIGTAISLGSALLILLIFFRKHFSDSEVFLLLFVITFGLAGLALLFAAIFRTSSGKFIYTREVNATCTGYVRTVQRETSDSNRRFTYVCVSPLFCYSVDGVQYEAIWDEFVYKKDVDISVGQTVPIKVDPRRPENIKSPATTHPFTVTFEILMGVAFTVIAAGLGFYILTGNAKNMKLETKWHPAIEKINGETESSLTKITDEMIQTMYKEKLGSDQTWYVETAVVAQIETSDEGKAITFTDEAFNGIFYKDGNVPEPGTSLIIFYTVDVTRLLSGKHYKRMFTTADPAKYVYSGSHTAYKMGS